MNTENIYNDLKNKQQEFIRQVAQTATDEGIPVLMDSTFTRGWLRKVAKSMNIEWAPAWIVKDVSRQRGRGSYAIPEVYAWTRTDPDFAAKMDSDAIANRILGDEITEAENAMDMMDPAVAGEVEINVA